MVAAYAAAVSIKARRESSGCVRMAEASDAQVMTSVARVERVCIVEPESMQAVLPLLLPQRSHAALGSQVMSKTSASALI